MIVEPPEAVQNPMLDTLGALMNGGTIEFLTADGKLVCELKLSTPATLAARDGELHFRKISEEVALLTGQLAAARICGSNGRLVVRVDVGDESSDAVIKFPITQIQRGTFLRLTSFKLLFSDIWREDLAARRLEQPGMRSLS